MVLLVVAVLKGDGCVAFFAMASHACLYAVRLVSVCVRLCTYRRCVRALRAHVPGTYVHTGV